MKAILEVLTKAHPRLLYDEDTGNYTKVEEDGLINQLRDAVFGGMETGGTTTGFKPRMPISSAALDLYEQLDEEITGVWLQAFPQLIPNADRVETLLTQIVASLPEDTIVTYATKTQMVDNRDTPDEHWWVSVNEKETKLKPLMQRWEQLIRDLFDPPRLAHIETPCPACNEEYAWKQQDGESIRYRVLSFARNEKGETMHAQCVACGNRWNKTEFGFLLRWIEENNTPEERTTPM